MAVGPCRSMIVRPSRLDLAERLVPGDAAKLAAPFASGALQRIKHAIRAVDAVLVVVDLDAQAAARERVVRIAAHVYRLAVADGGDHGAGVRTIVRAGAEDFVLGHFRPP